VGLVVTVEVTDTVAGGVETVGVIAGVVVPVAVEVVMVDVAAAVEFCVVPAAAQEQKRNVVRAIDMNIIRFIFITSDCVSPGH
jgi:hypothetical protein